MNSSLAAVAAVAQDSRGLFLGASTVTFSGILDPETLEAIACREGLALASDLLLQEIRVASDCANAIRSIQEESMGAVWPNYQRDQGDFRTVPEG